MTKFAERSGQATLGLRHRLIILFTVIMLLLLGSIGYWAYTRSMNNYRIILSRHLELAEETLSVKFQAQFEDAFAYLHIASDSRIQKFLLADSGEGPAAASSRMKEIFREHRATLAAGEDIYDISIIGITGNCYSERYGFFRLKSEFTEYDFARTAMIGRRQNIIHEEPVIVRDDVSEEVLTVTTGIFQTGTDTLLGTVNVDVSKSSLEHILNDIQWSPTSLVSITNQQGRPILHSSTGGFPPEVLNLILSSDAPPSSSPIEVGSVDFLVFYDELSFVPWTLVVGVQLSTLMSPQIYIANALLAAIIMCIIIIVLANVIISVHLVQPVVGLKELMRRAAAGDFEVNTDYGKHNEIAELYDSFGKMISQIKILMDDRLKEQEMRKSSELKLLQAQVNPHFLYNTLDAVVRVAEAGKNDEVVDLIIALSRFYRSTLNISTDVVPFTTVVEHAESFLIIMKKRYRDILDYRITVDPRVLEASFPKLSIQPLLDNAIYHGIKNRREGGLVSLDIQLRPESLIEITVADNGVGMTEENLNRLYEKLSSMSGYGSDAFGLRNINDRIKLIFGKEYGLEISSEYMAGTTVRIVVPFVKMKPEAGNV